MGKLREGLAAANARATFLEFLEIPDQGQSSWLWPMTGRCRLTRLDHGQGRWVVVAQPRRRRRDRVRRRFERIVLDPESIGGIGIVPPPVAGESDHQTSRRHGLEGGESETLEALQAKENRRSRQGFENFAMRYIFDGDPRDVRQMRVAQRENLFDKVVFQGAFARHRDNLFDPAGSR